MKVIKRNGYLVDFDKEKIVSAITKAGKETGEFGETIANKLADQVVNVLLQVNWSDNPPTVENIQDIVEQVLLSSPFTETAKAYIIYRDQHAKLREIKVGMNVDLMDQYLAKLDWKVNENSNMSFSLQGLNNYISSEVSKTYWLNKIYTPAIRDAHVNGDFHLHDLNLLSVYCVGWDLYDLLTKGFCGVEGKIESKPAKHFRTALGQIVNFFYTLQGEAAGAQAFSNFDTLLAPFIWYDNLTFEQVKQALQEFVFNINIPTRVGFQTPFTNVTFDLTVPSHYADQGVVIGGQIQDKTYKDFQYQMDMFNQAFIEVMSEGDAKGRVFTFPIPTYNITKDFDWDNPLIESLWDMAGKYGVPYFSNFINSDMNPEDARSMCCRLRIDNRELRKRGGGLFGANPLTGSIGVVTINLPRLAYKARITGMGIESFTEMLDNLIELAAESLETKRKVLEQYTDANLYPYTKFYLSGIKQRFGQYWKNHFSTIGIVGMNEACLNFLDMSIGSEIGKKFALYVSNYIRSKLEQLQERTGNLYNYEATPAEGTSYRLAMIDKEKYPDIICANEGTGGDPFYTNSTLLPVNYTDDLFEALDHQDELQTKYTGGTVMHLYLGERIIDREVVKNLVKKICTNYQLPYFTLSPIFSVCPAHGYLSGEHPTCPTCGRDTEVYARVVGYLRPIKQWNKGKQAEYSLRKKYAV